MQKLKNFYKDKKILVTGHTGFKGSWLVSTLLFFGAKVYGYSIADKHKKNYKNFCDYKKVHNFYGNVLDKKKLNNFIKKIQPEIIFHLAAQPLVSTSYILPELTFETNINGTLNILENAKKIKSIKSVLIVTSDKCYKNENNPNLVFNENHPLGGEDPYSASKAATEIIFNSYLKSGLISLDRCGIATARSGNVIGGGDWAKDRIIPDCVRSIINKKKIIIRNPKFTRPWQHVLETTSGYLILAKKLFEKPILFSSSYNFGPINSRSVSVMKLANIFLKEFNIKKEIKIKSKFKFKESRFLKLSSNKSLKNLGWKNYWSIKNSIKETARWYKLYFFKNKKIKKFTKNQINDFFDNQNL